MLKEARKPSTDIVQEKLRASKADWNKSVSALISDMIDCKKLLNGAPNKFHKEKSRIVDPIPADPITILTTLANDFNELAHQGNAIVQQQIDYAKTRKKKQQKTENIVAPNNLSTQLSLPLVAQIDNYFLLSEASNPLTRFWTKLITPTRFGMTEAARIRQYRMTLLKAAVIHYKTMGKIQVEIVKSSKESIVSSNKLMRDAWNEWLAVVKGFNTYVSNMPDEIANTGGAIAIGEYNAPENTNLPADIKDSQPEKQTINKHENVVLAENIKKDLLKSLPKFSDDKDLFQTISNLVGQLILDKDKSIHSGNIISEYKNILASLNTKYNTTGLTLTEIAKQRDNKLKTASLETLSQDFLKKWLGYGRHSLWADDTSVLRKDAYNMAAEIRYSLNSIMNSVEKGMNVKELSTLIKSTNSQMGSLKSIIRAMDKSDVKVVV